jgi:hypothetical protein
MSTKRRINSTGRKRINRNNIDIRMIDDAKGPLRATARLDLSEHDFPPASVISIEAYHRSSGMRFQCGTVASPAIPEVLVLDQIDQSGSVLFRVKVTESDADVGRILASAEKIQPSNENEDKDRKSLFPVLYRKLGEETWKVEINPDDRPKLVFNSDIPEIAHRVAHDPVLQGFVFPAAFRAVIQAMTSGEHDDEEDEETGETGWQAEWMKFCKERLGLSDSVPKSDDAIADWIDDAVKKFCAEFGFMKAIRKLAEVTE